MPSHHARAWVEIDLGALRRNGAALAALAGVPLLPMVKADGYGLGAVRVARALLPLGPWGFGVATVAEAAELRDAGIDLPVVVFSPLLPADFPAARAARATPTLGDASAIEAWRTSGGGDWHLAIDTGMSRAGARWDEVGALHRALAACPPSAAFTHFHSAELEDGTLEEQEGRFRDALGRLPSMPPLLHADNSPAIEHRGKSPWHLARPGVFLYGVGSHGLLRPEPVAHLRARVLEVRSVHNGEGVSYDATWRADGPRRVATLGVGYGDGYRRGLGNRAAVLIGGARCPVVGHVTMDMTMVDVSDVPCEPGDVATLLGCDAAGVLTAEEVASAGELSPYELLVGLRLRLPRVYRDEVAS